ncbi:MAG: hypothetical protein GF350_00195 [Chitinivibrionales bacterium]|nr:hypothetical protein [Chitinivibrionales bacterium]
MKKSICLVACFVATVSAKDIARSDTIVFPKQQTLYGSGFDLVSCEQITEKDICELCKKIRHKDPEEFEAIMLTNKFHQHIGPNNIYGAKMALRAKEILGGKDHEISVLSEAGRKPPVSCLNDGIMAAIGATYGRGLISTVPGKKNLSATFHFKDKAVRLEVKKEMLNHTRQFIKKSLKKHGGLTDEYFGDVRKMGLYVWENYDRKDLFTVTRISRDASSECAYNRSNVGQFYNSLHEFIHTGPDSKQIVEFIAKNPCVSDGSVEQTDTGMIIHFAWKSTGMKMKYEHE